MVGGGDGWDSGDVIVIWWIGIRSGLYWDRIGCIGCVGMCVCVCVCPIVQLSLDGPP